MFDTNLKHWMAASFVGAVVLVATVVNVNYPKAADVDVQSTPLMGQQVPCTPSEGSSLQPSASQSLQRSTKGGQSGSSKKVRPSAGSRLQRQGGMGGEQGSIGTRSDSPEPYMPQKSTGTREGSPEPYMPTGGTGSFQQPTAVEQPTAVH